MQRAHLKPKEERRLLRGHLWAFRNEFAKLPQTEDGALMDVYAANDRFVGRGFYQAQGGIGVRILSRHQEPIEEDFFRKRIEKARDFREQALRRTDLYRWLHGESDGLPGLMADRYGHVVSLQSTCAFYKRHADMLAEIFLSQPQVSSVLWTGIGAWGETVETVAVSHGDLQFKVDLVTGQKTGMYLDQLTNSLFMRGVAGGGRVLDGHCYTGLWSLAAARGGAVEVVGVDTSESAIALAQENAQINKLDGVCRFKCADVEEALANGEIYDVVAIDPPPLAKSRAAVSRALGRYQALNKAAMAAVKPGGCLITSVCSQAVDGPAFLELIKRAARAVGRDVWVLEAGQAAADHPVLLAMPETDYLTCLFLRVL